MSHWHAGCRGRPTTLSLGLIFCNIVSVVPLRWRRGTDWSKASSRDAEPFLALARLHTKGCQRNRYNASLQLQRSQSSTSDRPAPRSFRLWKPSEAPAKSSVAVCMAGQLRTLHLPAVVDNFERHVVRPLRPALFLHVSRERRIFKGIRSSRGTAGPTSGAEFEWILTQLRPVGVRLMDDADLLRSHNLTRRGGDATGHVACQWSSCVPLLLRFAGCAEDIERFEVESGSQLPWILRTRPDLMWSCELPALATWPVGRQVAWLHRDFLGLYSRDVGLRVLEPLMHRSVWTRVRS